MSTVLSLYLLKTLFLCRCS